MQTHSKSPFSRPRSVPLVCESQRGLQINAEALQFISTLPAKQCHILSIVGRAKTGKSALMNHLVHKFTAETQLLEYFPVSDSLGGGTKGITMLKDYVQLDQKNILLFLDVQGLGRFTNTETYQSKLFAVSLLLSTTLLYNNMGAIDEPALQNLSIFIQFGKMLQKSMTSQKDSFSLPSLYFVLRDFSLKLQDRQGFDVSAKQYMENALEEQKGSSQAVSNKNMIRRRIKQLFRERHCQTLVLPSDELPLRFTSQLRQQFCSDIDCLSNRLLSHFSQGQSKHRMLTPNEMVPYLTQLLLSVNQNARVPKFQCILANIYKKQIQQVKDKFKESVSKLSIEFDRQAADVQQNISSIQVSTNAQYGFIEKEIAKLQALGQSFNLHYLKARKEIQEIIDKSKSNQPAEQKMKYQALLDVQELRTLQITKVQKEEEIKRKIQELRELAELNRKACIQYQLQIQQKAQFQKMADELCALQNEKQLQKKYRSLISTLGERCSKVSSKQFEAGLLRCEVAFLRRKLQLRQRHSSTVCAACKYANEHVLKDKMNTTNPFVNQISFTSNFKNANLSKELQSEQMIPAKSFYVPYVILSDPNVMSVQIIRTLIKHDSRLNNYIEYVLEVVIMEKRWVFNRKWKDFNELHSILKSLFHHTALPEFANTQLGLSTHLEIQKQDVEQRRQKLEQYLRSLLGIQAIRNSRIMQKFLKINKEYVTTL